MSMDDEIEARFNRVGSMLGLAETLLSFERSMMKGEVTSFVFIYHTVREGEAENCHSKIAGMGNRDDLDHLLELLREGIARREFDREEKGDGRD